MCAIGTIPIPIVKKEDGKKKNDYRGIMLISTLYKVYMAILTKKLENSENKRIIPQLDGIQEENGDD